MEEGRRGGRTSSGQVHNQEVKFSRFDPYIDWWERVGFKKNHFVQWTEGVKSLPGYYYYQYYSFFTLHSLITCYIFRQWALCTKKEHCDDKEEKLFTSAENEVEGKIWCSLFTSDENRKDHLLHLAEIKNYCALHQYQPQAPSPTASAFYLVMWDPVLIH